jgi:hypothetical protein
MYQTLMWGGVRLGRLGRMLRDHARGLGAALDSKDVQRAANALIDRVRRDVQLGSDFLGRQVLVDQAQAIELARAKAGDAGGRYRIIVSGTLRSRHLVGHPSSFQTPRSQ